MTDQAHSPHDDDDAPLDDIMARRLTGPRYSVYERLMREKMARLEALSGPRALYIVDPKATPADGIEMIDEAAELFLGRPGTGKSFAPELAFLAAAVEAALPGLAEELAMHLAGVHADATAMDTDPEDNVRFHQEEHEGGHDHPEDDLSYDPARVIEILTRHQEDAEDRSLSEETWLALHLACGHHDDQAFFRTVEQNEAAHRAIPGFMHQHTDVQHRYERALAEKIEADLGDGTLLSWRPARHAPDEITDLARMLGDIHERTPEMTPDLIALDLAWLKTAGWPWYRRLMAAAMIAFPFFAWPPSHLDRRVRRSARR
jgi:hypothetical protein